MRSDVRFSPPPDLRQDLWAERGSTALRWALTVLAGIALADLAISSLSDGGTSLDPLRLCVGAFALTGLLCWWRFDALAVGLALPLAVSVWLGDAGAGMFFLPATLGVLAATASGGYLLVALGLSAAWIATVPLFAPVDSLLVPLVVVLELVSVSIGLSARVRAVRHDQDQSRLEATRRRLAEQAEVERRAAEDVRRSVARDLHDVVAHGLTVIKLQADVALFASDLDRARDALSRISDTSQQSLTDLRVMLRLLQTPTLSGGQDDHGEAASTLRLEVTGPQFRDTLAGLGYPTTLTMDPDVARLTRGEETALHRVLQEASTNVLKHAPEGTPVSIDLAVREPNGSARAILTVTNEIGPDGLPQSSPDEVGPLRLGLLTMRERVDALGGSLQAGLVNGRWVVAAEIPVRLRTRLDVPATG